MAAGDSYPFVGWLDFAQFCRQVDLLDNNVNGAVIDSTFFATKFNPQPGGEGKQLFRHEFLEILLRLSKAKYFDTGLVETPVEGLEKLLDIVIDGFELSPW